jgi:hypothetical protein
MGSASRSVRASRPPRRSPTRPPRRRARRWGASGGWATDRRGTGGPRRRTGRSARPTARKPPRRTLLRPVESRAAPQASNKRTRLRTGVPPRRGRGNRRASPRGCWGGSGGRRPPRVWRSPPRSRRPRPTARRRARRGALLGSGPTGAARPPRGPRRRRTCTTTARPPGSDSRPWFRAWGPPETVSFLSTDPTLAAPRIQCILQTAYLSQNPYRTTPQWALLHTLIHPSAWKVNSANFGLTEF